MAESIKNKYSNLGALTDSVILSLYKSVGLQNRLRSSADYDWVRQKFGNNIGSLTKMLGQEKEKAAKSIGGDTKSNTELPSNSSVFSNAIANYKEQPEAKEFNPYFVKFTADPNGTASGDQSTVWLMDEKNKVLRPILNWQAFSDLYEGDEKAIQDAVSSINYYNPMDLQPGGKLNGYLPLGAEYAVNEGANVQELPFSPATIQRLYGKNASSEDVTKAASFLSKNFLPFLAKNGVSSDFINKIASDPLLMSGYAAAYTYGGYTPEDLFMDIKSRELADEGDTKYSNVRFIDGAKSREEYSQTNEYKSNYNDPKLINPAIRGLSFAQQNIGYINQHPDEIFQAFDPEYAKVKNDRVKAAMEDVQSVLHDKVLEVLNAKTDAQKQAAEQDWSDYKSDVERNLGWKLSDNALEAWNQLQALQSSFNQAGLTDTGVENSAIDQYLKNVRNTNDKERDIRQTDITRKTEEHAKQYASPAEIQKMNDEDQAKGLPRNQWRSVLWGLAPAEAMTKEKYLSDFRAKYTDEASKKLTDKEIIDMYYSQQYDDNGNYRSAIYEAKNNQDINIKYGQDINFNYLPSQSAADYKYAVALEKINQEDIDKMAPYDSQNSDPNNPNFNKSYGTGPTGSTSTTEAVGTTGTSIGATGAGTGMWADNAVPSGPQNIPSTAGAINTHIKTLIDTNRTLNNNDADQMFMYYYGRPATAVEKSYWTKKTSKQLEAALKPNAGQFKNAGYYKDTQKVATPASVTSSSAPIKPATVTPPAPTTGMGLYKPATQAAATINTPKVTAPQPSMSSVGTYKPAVQTPTPTAPATDDFASSIKSQAGLNWLKQRGLNK